MRKILLLVTLISSISIEAQTLLPMGFTEYNQPLTFGNNNHFFDSAPGKKWFLSTYSGIATGFSFFNGVSATMLSVPLTLQLNRRLNNNLYAFAAVSAGPAFINFNRSFLSADVNKAYPANGFFPSGNLGMYSKAELGLMYVNDAKTFSLSGSIGVERSSYPVFPYQQIRTTRSNQVIPVNK